MVECAQDGSFCVGSVELVLLGEFSVVDDFHCVGFCGIVAEVAEIDGADVTGADAANQFEVLWVEFGC